MKPKAKGAEDQFSRRLAQLLLYVDDNPDDVLFFQEAARTAAPSLTVHCVSGPAAAMDYLDDLSSVVDRQPYLLPALVLLDTHFQGWSGPSLTRRIRAHPWLASLPIVIFTGAEAPAHIAKCYEEGADHFLVKPSGPVLTRLLVIAQALHEYIASNPVCCELLRGLPEYRSAPASRHQAVMPASLSTAWVKDRSSPRPR